MEKRTLPTSRKNVSKGSQNGARRPCKINEKSDAFFVLIFDSFWGRLGVVLGPIWGAKIDSKSEREFGKNRSCFRSCGRMVPRWLQDRPKRALGGVLGRLGGSLGPSLAGLGGLLGVLRGSWAALGDSWSLLERSWRPVDIYCSTLSIFIVFCIEFYCGCLVLISIIDVYCCCSLWMCIVRFCVY